MRTHRRVALVAIAASHCSLGTCLSLPTTRRALCEVELDYSGVNEFVQAHYDESHYFPRDRAKEPIHDARQGLCEDGRRPSLDNCGFALKYAPTAVADFEDLHHIRSVYLPELRHHVIPSVMKGVSNIVFWHPVYREEGRSMSGSLKDNVLPVGTTVPLVHIDTDVGAYNNAEEIVDLIDKNRFDDDKQRKSFSKDRLVDALNAGRRFAILNIWRNADTKPIQRAPLGMLATQYSPQEPLNHCCFPKRPSSTTWYTFPDMKREECLLFKQYDRNVLKPSDIWHCALLSVGSAEALPRKSFDVRAFVVLDEMVPPELDRFGPDRIRNLLTRDESGCFCDTQARARQSSS